MALSAYFLRQRQINQFNVGNTVLVSALNNDDFYLGFLQNINGGSLFIDFDSGQMPAQWVSISRVWHHERSSIRLVNDPRDVYVAIRLEHDGPYTFRPAKLLRSYGYESRFLCCITFDTDTGLSSTGNEKPNLQIVHGWQLVHRLPIDRRIYRICRLPFKKVIYRSSRVSSALNGIQERTIVNMLYSVFREDFLPLNENWDRLFVRISEEEIMFLIMRIQCKHVRSIPCASGKCWRNRTNKMITEGVEKFLLRYCCGPLFHHISFSNSATK
ncbi:uncharacterized protein LOC129598787 [Paramacrobiotus metropolitanus]|uniref:uncharacterized protein LOC129598787 n=1 Tax=Paramacrobiotus metropolitanus TaxID=2943436 RepID=UPI00244627B3|nr:uncharacterized protein LOC129598787 [Paramacrobiotus metropolitanus]